MILCYASGCELMRYSNPTLAWVLSMCLGYICMPFSAEAEGTCFGLILHENPPDSRSD